MLASADISCHHVCLSICHKSGFRFKFINVVVRRLKIKENEIQNLNKQSKKHYKIQYNRRQNNTAEYTTL